MKRIVFIATILLLSQTALLHATTYSGTCGPELTYTLDSETGHLVIEGRGAMTSDEICNYPKRDYVKTISFPAGLTSICANAFHGCYNLQSFVLPDSVISIGACAFQECSKLTYCDLGKGVKSIGDQAFIFCSTLRKVRWSDCLESIGSMAFYNCSQLGDTIFFPKTLKKLGSWIFHCESSGCSKVAVWETKRMNDFTASGSPLDSYFYSVYFGDSVEYIPAYLARYMYNDSIVLPETVTGIGAYAFGGCSKMTKINIPESVTTIGSSAFAGCKKLKQLILPLGMREIPEQLCNLCEALDSVRLPVGLIVIPQKAFNGCTSLHSIHIPNSVTNIGNSAFAGCPLDTLVLPNALNVLGDCVFNNLNTAVSPRHLVLNDKLIATGMATFCNWKLLKTITIGKNVAILGQDCFRADSAVTDITCYATQPPLIYDATFDGVPDSAYLHVLPECVAAYRTAQDWSRFRIVALDDSTLVQRQVTVEAEQTTAQFTWPTDSAAAKYTLDIYRSGIVFCRLTLGPTGQLLGIAFAAPPTRAPQSIPETLGFMVTGLSSATMYNYVLAAVASDNTPMHVYLGAFATEGYTGPIEIGGYEIIPTPPVVPYNPAYPYVITGLDQPSSVLPTCGKCLYNGQIIIYTPDGQYYLDGRLINR